MFLSYASEAAEAAARIADALRAAGIEVWFDKSELRGGDAWDRQIRRQIHNRRTGHRTQATPRLPHRSLHHFRENESEGEPDREADQCDAV